MLILDALSLNPTPRRPIWVMRQAGRYMKAFREIRAKHSFLELCDSPELAVQVSLLPIKAFELDAAIVFSDILIPLRALGAKVEFGEGGPVLSAPSTVHELDSMRKTFDPQADTPAILATLKTLRAEVSKEKAVLGFSGAPFTLLAYLLEGKLTKDLSIVKKWMFEQPEAVHRWLDILSDQTSRYLEAQVAAGADAVQVFDTWAGNLSPRDYEIFALPYARKVFSHITAPGIYYVNGVSGILDQVLGVGAQALSIDWRLSLKEARRRVPQTTALQGNLDPLALHLPKHLLRERVLQICEDYGRQPGHIFNLGHGIVPGVPEDSVRVICDAVREF